MGSSKQEHLSGNGRVQSIQISHLSIILPGHSLRTKKATDTGDNFLTHRCLQKMLPKHLSLCIFLFLCIRLPGDFSSDLALSGGYFADPWQEIKTEQIEEASHRARFTRKELKKVQS